MSNEIEKQKHLTILMNVAPLHSLFSEGWNGLIRSYRRVFKKKKTLIEEDEETRLLEGDVSKTSGFPIA